MVRKTKATRKLVQEKHTKAMTIPELRKAFENVERFVQKNKDLDAFRKMWKKTFGKEVSESAARDYLAFVSSQPTTQKGGAAPLDYQTRAGVDDLTYGSFQKYVLGGMAFPKDSFHMSNENITPRIPADMGSNTFMKGGRRKTRRGVKQKGGALYPTIAEALTRPFIMNSPPSMVQDAQMLAKGHAGFSSPRPEINDLPNIQYQNPYTASAAKLPQTI